MGGAFPLARLGISLIAASGASKIIQDAVVHTARIETTAQMVRVWTGSLMLGAMVGDYTGRFTQHQIDAVHEIYRDWKDKNSNDPK